jgi:hypothetical protein
MFLTFYRSPPLVSFKTEWIFLHHFFVKFRHSYTPRKWTGNKIWHLPLGPYTVFALMAFVGTLGFFFVVVWIHNHKPHFMLSSKLPLHELIVSCFAFLNSLQIKNATPTGVTPCFKISHAIIISCLTQNNLPSFCQKSAVFLPSKQCLSAPLFYKPLYEG